MRPIWRCLWCWPLVLVSACTACKERSGASRPEQRRAEQIWRERCAECHGPTGRGDGPRAAKLSTAPRDFADASWQRSKQSEELARVIVSGGRAAGYSAEMPPNPDLAREPDVVSELVQKIRSFRR